MLEPRFDNLESRMNRLEMHVGGIDTVLDRVEKAILMAMLDPVVPRLPSGSARNYLAVFARARAALSARRAKTSTIARR